MNTGGQTGMVGVRKGTEDDAEAIARLACELGYPADATAMRGRVRRLSDLPTDVLFVAVDSSDAAVGWLQAHASLVVESGYRAEIVGLIVSPAARRGGVGRALVAEAERWARSIGADMVVVRSNVTRTESHAFYPALGYAATKTQQVYRKSLGTVAVES